MWPVAGIFAIEKISSLKDKKTSTIYNKFGVRTLTVHVRICTIGFSIAFLVSPLFLLHFPQMSQFLNYWCFMSFLGGIFGIVAIILGRTIKETQEWKDRIVKKTETGIRKLLTSNTKTTLFNLWLICTGLLYMYYSTIAIASELLFRQNFIISKISMSLLLLLFIFISFLGHSSLGWIVRWIWNNKNWNHSKNNMLFYKFYYYLDNFFYKVVYFFAITLIGRTSSDDSDNNSKKIRKSSDEKLTLYGNVDIMVIIFLGYLLIILGLIGCLLFSINVGPIWTWLAVIFFMILIYCSNSGFALIPSLLSSRFPIKLRSTGSGLAYNGGLVLGFASPFVSMSIFLNYPNYNSIFFVTIILGAIAMIVGGRRILNDYALLHDLKNS